MMSEKKNNVILEEYENKFLYKKNKTNLNIEFNRIAFIFFVFLIISTIYSIQLLHLGSLKKTTNNIKPLVTKKNYRADITDRNGNYLVKTVDSINVGIHPGKVINKKHLLLMLNHIYKNKNLSRIKKKLDQDKFFYLEKNIRPKRYEELMMLGDKSISSEASLIRLYPQDNLFSHIIGQINNDNYGISGIEYYFDRELRDRQKAKAPLILSLDSNIQFLIKTQLEKALEDFQANSAGGLLMDVNSGEVLSLVSLPDYNLNIRKNISDVKYMNKITKGVFELGSVFKTFTVALALEENILSPETIINNIPDNVKCSVHNISDIHDFPKSLSVEDILIRSSNIGSLMIARQIGKTKFKKFIEELGLLKVVNFELEEVGQPHNFKWEKCKLETVSFGHGITTTPLQAAAAYASITNGGYIIKPTLQLGRNSNFKNRDSIISNKTSDQINKILRKVVTEKKGTASNANIYGYKVGGKTGTAKNYKNSKKNINTFISIFPSNEPKYVLLVILDDPKGAPHLIYNYKGKATTNISRTEAGWNSVYVSGKIIEKIGPILAINNNEVHDTHVVKKNN